MSLSETSHKAARIFSSPNPEQFVYHLSKIDQILYLKTSLWLNEWNVLIGRIKLIKVIARTDDGFSFPETQNNQMGMMWLLHVKTCKVT